MNNHHYPHQSHAEQPGKPERPELAELWKLAKDQGINVIVLTTFERFSRDPVRAAAIRNKLQPISVEQSTSNLN